MTPPRDALPSGRRRPGRAARRRPGPSWLIAAGAATLAAPAAAAGQAPTWQDLVVTMGGSAETYRGNLSSVSVPVVDSSDHASAAVGELGLRGSLVILADGEGRPRAELAFDGGLRQFAATGFELRDYAPREWVGRATATWHQRLGELGRATLRVGGRGRSVSDRPPMPLFLQPGFAAVGTGVLVRLREIEGVRFDAEVDAEWTDYRAGSVLPQLDMLDRRSRGLELGAEWGVGWAVRFYGGYRWSDYPDQPSFDPDDPYRRDNALHAGALWTWQGPVIAQLGVEGTLNRSNSRRPEYDAVSLRTLVSAPLPWGFGANLLAVLTGKSYLQENEYARLVPGEEADNASVVYLDLNRALAPDLDAALRLGWTRAETDIGGAYYERFGVGFLLNYRPEMF